MKLILYQATIAITEIDFAPGPFRCQIELGHLDSAVGYWNILHPDGRREGGQCEKTVADTEQPIAAPAWPS